MPVHTLTLNLPEPLYNHLALKARAGARSIDDLVVETLTRNAPPPVEDDLPIALQLELKALEALSDDTLWAIAQSRINDDKVALYDLLLERRQTNALTAEGQELLNNLSAEADFLMVRKAHAYVLLQSRGILCQLLREDQPSAAICGWHVGNAMKVKVRERTQKIRKVVK